MSTQWKRLGWLLAAIVALKILLVLADGTPAVFMGDSASYLSTGLHGYIPPDRSYLYGFLLRPFAIWPHSLRALVFVQAILSGVAAWLVAFILIRFVGLPFRWAATLALLCAVEPLQLISERYVMTDTLAVFLFAVLVMGTIGFVAERKQIWLAVVLVSGILLVAIRISYLPVVVVAFAGLPLFWLPSRTAMCVVWLAAGQLALYGYKYLTASLSKMPAPAYEYADGFLLASDVAPFVEASDFPAPLSGEKILANVQLSRKEPILRDAHMYSNGGLCWAIRQAVPDDFQANRIAKQVGTHAILWHLPAFLALGLHTWQEYFIVPLVKGLIVRDEGGLRPNQEGLRQEVLVATGDDLATQSVSGFVWRYHRAAIPWYWCLIVLPMTLPFVLVRRGVYFLSAYLLLSFGPTILLAHSAEPRYLMPIAWMVFLSVGLIFSSSLRKSDARADLPAPAN